MRRLGWLPALALLGGCGAAGTPEDRPDGAAYSLALRLVQDLPANVDGTVTDAWIVPTEDVPECPGPTVTVLVAGDFDVVVTGPVDPDPGDLVVDGLLVSASLDDGVVCSRGVRAGAGGPGPGAVRLPLLPRLG